jgi:hypothetical protein
MRWSRIIWLGITLFAAEASTSEHHDELDLKQTLARTTLVFVAAPARPATRTDVHPIAPKGTSEEKYPPYRQELRRYTVREVLWSQDAAPAKGSVLELAPADSESRRTTHEEYYLHDIREIPIYAYYTATVPPAKGAKELIVLARWNGTGWEFSAAGSVEGLDARAQVQALLAKGAAEPKALQVSP